MITYANCDKENPEWRYYIPLKAVYVKISHLLCPYMFLILLSLVRIKFIYLLSNYSVSYILSPLPLDAKLWFKLGESSSVTLEQRIERLLWKSLQRLRWREGVKGDGRSDKRIIPDLNVDIGTVKGTLTEDLEMGKNFRWLDSSSGLSFDLDVFHKVDIGDATWCYLVISSLHRHRAPDGMRPSAVTQDEGCSLKVSEKFIWSRCRQWPNGAEKLGGRHRRRKIHR